MGQVSFGLIVWEKDAPRFIELKRLGEIAKHNRGDVDRTVLLEGNEVPVIYATPELVAALEYAVEQLSGGKKDEEESDLYGCLVDLLSTLSQEADDADTKHD